MKKKYRMKLQTMELQAIALQEMVLENTKYTRATLELVLNKEKDKLTKHINETYVPIKLDVENIQPLQEFGNFLSNQDASFIYGLEMGILWEKLKHRPEFLEGLFFNENYNNISEVAGMFGYDMGTNPMKYTDTHNYITLRLREK